jgi:hypothetical protein
MAALSFKAKQGAELKWFYYQETTVAISVFFAF